MDDYNDGVVRTAPKRRQVGNLLALAVLSYLCQRPMHPYEVSRTRRDHGDARSIKFNHGSLYMVFKQLEKAGFITEHETTRADQRPERTVYAITNSGRHEMRDWLRELIEEPRREYPHFVAALSLIAALPPDEAVGLLRRRARRIAAEREETRGLIADTLATGVHPLFLVEEDYRLALLDAEAGFIDDFIERITQPGTGWAPQCASSMAASRKHTNWNPEFNAHGTDHRRRRHYRRCNPLGARWADCRRALVRRDSRPAVHPRSPRASQRSRVRVRFGPRVPLA